MTLRDAVEEYLTVRRALGSAIPAAAGQLRRFATFLESQGADFVTTKLALLWAQQSTKAEPATWAERLGVVRRFATWRNVTDPRTEIPPKGLLPHRRRRKPPYIYSDEEIEQIVDHSARLESFKGLRGSTYSTLFGLLAASGLRLGEALALDSDDVDLAEGILNVRKGKFGKSRLVPLHDSTRQQLVIYASIRDRIIPQRSAKAFFVTERGTRFRHGIVEWTFAKVSCEIGLRNPTAPHRTGRNPRLHDLRHHLAVARIIAWYRAGLDVERELPKLATYLGHVHVRHSYWYIEAVPELLELATERFADQRKQAVL